MLKYCCRECEEVLRLSHNKCQNQCPKTWDKRGNVNKLYIDRCSICDYQGCDNFRPFKEYR